MEEESNIFIINHFSVQFFKCITNRIINHLNIIRKDVVVKLYNISKIISWVKYNNQNNKTKTIFGRSQKNKFICIKLYNSL